MVQPAAAAAVDDVAAAAVCFDCACCPGVAVRRGRTRHACDASPLTCALPRSYFAAQRPFSASS